MTKLTDFSSDPAVGMDRRGFVIGAGAAIGALFAPGLALAADSQRSFKLYQDKTAVGHHTVSARKTGEGLQVDIRMLVELRRLGIRYYVYEHQNTEVWQGGKLMKLNATTNNNGAQQTCRVTRSGAGLQISGSGFSGAAPGDARPASYWNHDNFKSKQWFSVENGKLLKLRFRRTQQGPLESWSINGDLNTTLIYDNQQEWVGGRFNAGGAAVVYRQTSRGPSFKPMI